MRILRPAAATLAGAAILFAMGKLWALPMERVGPVVRALVVQFEFNPGQKCGGTVMAEPIDHLEEGKMAVAIKVDDDWDLVPDVCEVEKRRPKQQ